MGTLSFYAPYGLALAGLVVPLVLLYILKAKRPRVKVASTWLWRSAARDVMAHSPWKKLRAELPLVLEALALVALAIAFARPVARTKSAAGQTFALIMDVSASMSASSREGAQSPTRFDEAKRAARAWARGLPPGARVLVIQAGRDARTASPLDGDARRLSAAIDALAPLDVEGNLDAAIALAADQLKGIDSSEIVVVTDGNLAHPPDLEGIHVPVEVLTVGEHLDNVGITRISASTASDPTTHKETTQVFLVIGNFGTSEREVYATLRRRETQGKDTPVPGGGASLLASRRLVLAPGERAPVVLAFEPDASDIGSGLVVDVSPHDAFPADDVAFVRVPEGERLPVVLATKAGAPSPWLERALSSDSNVELTTVDVARLGDLEHVDRGALIVVDGACPSNAPGGDLLVVNPPPGDCRGTKVGGSVERPTVTSWSTSDERLRFLSLDGVSIAHASELSVADPKAALVRAGAIPLIVDLAIPSRTGTLVGFDVGESDWPLKASFVVFIRNVVEQARADRSRRALAGARTGEPLRLPVDPDVSSVTIVPPDGPPYVVDAREGLAITPPLYRAGFYGVTQNGQGGDLLVPVNLTSAAESDLSSTAAFPSGAIATTRKATDTPVAFREFGAIFVAVALLLLLWDVLIVTRGFSFRGRPVLIALLAVGMTLPIYEILIGVGWVNETFVRLERPWATALLPVGMVLVASRLSSPERARRGKSRTALEYATASLATFALALGVAGPSLGRPLRRLTVILAVDESRSIDLVPDASLRMASEVRRAEAGMQDDDRLGTVVFGATAATEEEPRKRGDSAGAQHVLVGRDGTDIDLALRRALSDIPPDSAGRIVLVSDGVATRGDTLSGAAATVAAEVPVDTLALEQRRVPDVRVVSLLGPSRGDAGEAVDLRVVTSASQETPVEVRVLVDGSILSKTTATLLRGEDVLRIREKLTDPGLHRYEVQITPLDPALDFSADDNAATAFVRVRGDATALVLEGDKGKGAFIASALRAAGFRVDEAGVEGAPADLGGFARYDFVVLSDIRASSLAPPQIDALASYVRDFGGGLLLMGGDRSLGPGGYGKTPIEEISPVSFDLKEKSRRARLAEVIGIDISGSMGMVVGGRTKLELANEAAARSVALLGSGDHLGIEHVDTEVHWSVPLGAIGDRVEIDRAIRSVQVGGGGIIVPITMDAGYAALDKETTSLKHMLLFADGDDAEEIKAAMHLTPEAKTRGITTSTVALGAGKDVADLEEMAKLGGGRFYLVEDAARLPSVFAEETILAARAAISEEPFHVEKAASSAAIAGIDFTPSPALGGYVVTLPKSHATVSLVGPDGDPILASWQIGVGKCGAFTSDLKDRWGVNWTGWPPAARLVAQTARDLQRRADDERVSVEADTTGGDLHIRATAAFDNRRKDSFRRLTAHVGGPDGFARDVELEPMGTGAYAATVPLTRAGTYIAVVKDAASGDAVASTGAVLSAGEELRPTGTDHALLARIAKITGGQVRTTLDGVFRDRPHARYAYQDISRILVLLAAVLLLVMVASRRLSVRVSRKATNPVLAAPAHGRAEPVASLQSVPSEAPDPTDPSLSGEPRALPDSPGPHAANGSTAELLAAKRRKRRARR